MIWINLNLNLMKLVCPECKNEVDLMSYPNLKKDDIVECSMCGITLQVSESGDSGWVGVVVDEGK